MIVEDFNFDEPKTKELLKILNALKVDGKKVLILTKGNLTSVYKSGRNIPKIKILEVDKASTYDIVNNQMMIIQKSAVEDIVNTFRTKSEAVN